MNAHADLNYRIGGDITPFRRVMSNLTSEASRAGNSMQRSFAPVTAGVNGISTALRALPALAGALGIAQAARLLRDVSAQVAEIKAEAETAGVDVETFQELEFAFRRAKIGTDALTDGLKELQLRADEFVVTGKGSAAEAFNRLGYDAETLGGKLSDPSKLLDEIIEKLRTFDRAAAIRVADEIFGGQAGEQFVRLLDESVGRISDIRSEARQVGAVLDRELIEKAAELDRRFGDIAQVVDVRLKSALLGVVDVIDSAAASSRAWLNDLSGGLVAARNLGQIAGQLAAPNDDGGASGKTRRLSAVRTSDDILREAIAYNKLNAARFGAEKAKTGSARGRSSGASSVQRERDAVAELIDNLEFELDLIGKSEVERRVAIELRRAGAKATEEQKMQIRDLVEAEIVAKEELAALEEQQQRYNDAIDEMASRTADWLDGLVDGSLDAKDVLRDLSKELSRGILLGDGMFGNLFSGGTGGGLLQSVFKGILSFEGGGKTPNRPRSGGLDGRGGFLAMLHPNERVDDETRGGGGAVEVVVRGVFVDDGGVIKGVAQGEAATAAGKVAAASPLIAQQTSKNAQYRRIAPTQRMVG